MQIIIQLVAGAAGIDLVDGQLLLVAVNDIVGDQIVHRIPLQRDFAVSLHQCVVFHERIIYDLVAYRAAVGRIRASHDHSGAVVVVDEVVLHRDMARRFSFFSLASSIPKSLENT